VPRGINGAEGSRNAPAIINRGYGTAFFWDGRAATLEQQVLEPILNPKELGLTETELVRRTGMKPPDIAAALSSYVRSIRSGNSRFDAYVTGDSSALTDLQKAGLLLFRGKGGCNSCHVGPNLTDERFHNTGVAWHQDGFTDLGRFAVSGETRDLGAFKTPTL